MYQKIMISFLLAIGIFCSSSYTHAQSNAQSNAQSTKSVLVGCLGPACPWCNTYLQGKLSMVPGVQKMMTHYKESTFTLVPKPGATLDPILIKQAVDDSGYTLNFIKLSL